MSQMNLKRLSKIKWKLRNMFKKDSFTKEELRIMAVVKKLLEDEDSSFIITPYRYCVENKKREVTLFIEKEFTIFANHSFHISDKHRLAFTETLMKMVDKKRSKDLDKLKEEVLKNKKDIYSNFYKET